MLPVIIFENKAQAYEYLDYYKSILGLNNWIIDINLQYDVPVIAPNWGSSSIWRAMHIAEIFLPMPMPGQINPFPAKYCQEEILVHELLHVRLPNTKIDVDTTEGDFFQAETHATLEQLAKAIIMARYGLAIDWFYNF